MKNRIEQGTQDLKDNIKLYSIYLIGVLVREEKNRAKEWRDKGQELSKVN